MIKRIGESQETQGQVELDCIRVRQPIGTFFIASISHDLLTRITRSDVRRMLSERPFETYLGIQRPLDPKRVNALKAYVNTRDACFPTSVVLAIDGKCAAHDENRNKLILRNFINPEHSNENVHWVEIARVLDGQHRIEGLKDYNGEFEINVCIFIDIDIQDQAYLFSTVNLTQTKVNSSLAYDLFELAKTRSPQKCCHNVAVSLDQTEGSPLYHRIKRLGTATPGRYGETLTQATVVEALLPYLTANQVSDRDVFLRGRIPSRATPTEEKKLIFRNMFIEERDLEIFDVIWNFFGAVQEKWPHAWRSGGQGYMLNKTNGFRALMRLLRPCYLYLVKPGEVPSKSDFFKIISKARLTDDDFTIERFLPGTGGEALLFRTLQGEMGLSSID